MGPDETASMARDYTLVCCCASSALSMCSIPLLPVKTSSKHAAQASTNVEPSIVVMANHRNSTVLPVHPQAEAKGLDEIRDEATRICFSGS